MTSPACRIAAGRRLRAIQGRCYKYSKGQTRMLIQCCLDVWPTLEGDKGKHANRAHAI